MEILLWLVPPVVVSGIAMVWVGWLGREGRGRIDREEAARRMGVALDRESRVPAPRARVSPERSTGVAVRRPADAPAAAPTPARAPTPAAQPDPAEPSPAPRRLAS